MYFELDNDDIKAFEHCLVLLSLIFILNYIDHHILICWLRLLSQVELRVQEPAVKLCYLSSLQIIEPLASMYIKTNISYFIVSSDNWWTLGYYWYLINDLIKIFQATIISFTFNTENFTNYIKSEELLFGGAVVRIFS